MSLQVLNNVALVFGRSKAQRRLAEAALAIEVGSLIDREFHDLGIFSPDSGHEERVVEWILGFTFLCLCRQGLDPLQLDRGLLRVWPGQVVGFGAVIAGPEDTVLCSGHLFSFT
jgi:hypothetical protein